MARKIQSRLQIKGTLMTETPLHIGGYGESYETDMALARNGRDEFYIPGTSLAGALRAWFENAFGEDEAIGIWGFQEDDKKKPGTKDDRSNASFVLIEDLTLPGQIQSELRDGVGINRSYGTAASQAKFDRAILPKGAKLNLEMTVEIQKDAPKIKAMFGHLLEASAGGDIRLGAAKTRGLGKVKLKSVEIVEQISGDRDSLLQFLAGKSLACSIQDLKDSDPSVKANSSSKLTIAITWQPKSALMVKAGYDGIGVDMLPLTSADGRKQVSLCLPGSSIKGAFRSHAERIVRTLKPDSFPRENDFHEQIKVDLVTELFGAKKEQNGGAGYLGLGVLSVDDCYAEQGMEEEVWREAESGEMKNDKTYSDSSQGLWQALKKVDLNKRPEENLSESEKSSDTKNFRISHHVAIDRWTGGASEGALYSVLQPAAATRWNDIRLSLDLSPSRLLPDKKLKSLMLLLLVLRDFAENRLALGFATNRGMGEVGKVSFSISGLYDIGWDQDAKRFIFTDENLKENLEKEWREWLETR